MSNRYKLIVILFLLLVTFQPLAAEDWFTHHHDYQRLGVSTIPINETLLTRSWMYTEPINIVLFSNPVVAYGKVLYVSTDGAGSDPNGLTCLNASTGDSLWHHVLPAVGLSGRGTPTVAIIDTSLLLKDTVVFVGVGGNSFRCIDLETGNQIWNVALGAGNNASFSPSVVVGNNVIFGHDGRRIVARNVKTGVLAWQSPLLNGRPYMGPSVSNDTIFTGTWLPAPTGDGSGDLYAINANDGSIIASYDPGTNVAFPSGPIVWGNHIIAVSFNVDGTTNLYVWDSHDLTQAPRISPTNTGGVLYSTPCGYVTPSGESLVVYGTEFPLIKARILSDNSAPPLGPLKTKYNLFTDGFVETAVAIASNGRALVGDDFGILYVFDAATGAVYWTKQFSSPFLSGPAIASLTGPIVDTPLVVVAEAFRKVFGFKHSTAPRPRTEVLVRQVDLNIITAGSGSDTATLNVYMNAGNAPLIFSVRDTVIDTLISGTSTGFSAHVSLVNPLRQKQAEKLADELTVTSAKRFYDRENLKYLAGDDPVLFSRTSLIGDKKKSFAKNTALDWLTVVSNTPSPVAPGDTINLTLSADGTGLTRGYKNGYVILTPTNEPDPTPYPGDVGIYSPLVRLLVGFPYIEATTSSPILDKLVTNYGGLAFVDAFGAVDVNNFHFQGINHLYDGSFIIGNDSLTLALDVFQYDKTLTVADDTINVVSNPDSTITTTAFLHNAGLGLKVVQTTKVYSDIAKANFIIYKFDITNTTASSILGLTASMYLDWDVEPDYLNNLGGADTSNHAYWQYEATNPTRLFGIMHLPTNTAVFGFDLVNNPFYVYGTGLGFTDGVIWNLMNKNTVYLGDGTADDWSSLLTAAQFDLPASATRTERFAIFGVDTTQIKIDSLSRLINRIVTDVKDIPNATAGVPKKFELGQNYPNPFNASTVIKFNLPQSSQVKLDIYNLLGQKVKTLVNEKLSAGYKKVIWDGTNQEGNSVASGIYFYKLQTDKFTEARKMVMLK